MKKKFMLAAVVAATVVGLVASVSSVLPIFASQTYEEKLEAYNKAIEQYRKDLEAYNNKVKECENLKTEYQNKLTTYNTAKAKYDEEYKKYEEAMKRARENSGKNGYLSRPTGQSLVFRNEPSATVQISGQSGNLAAGAGSRYSADEIGSGDLVGSPVISATPLPDGASNRYGILMEKGKTTTVTYSNLRNTTYKGKKISKVVYKYTPVDVASANNKMVAFIYQDPTDTISVGSKINSGAPNTVKMEVEFYYEDGSRVNFENDYPAVVSFASLNAGDAVDPLKTSSNRNSTSVYREFVKDLNGVSFIKISGSAVDIHNGSIYSATNIDSYWSEWDSNNSSIQYVGAGAGVLSGSNISFVFGNTNSYSQWFQFNSSVKAAELPEKPVEPTKPEEPNCTPPQKPTEPTKPEEPMCNIRVRYISKNGNDLIPPANVFDSEQKCGTDYKTEKKTFDGYRFEKMHDDSCDANGKLEDGSDCEVIYVYVPICNIKVKHIDANGNELIPSKNVFEEDQDCGTPYETKKEEIPGYTFKEMHSDSCDPNGTLEKDSDCEVIYVYVPICNIKVKHIDVYGNTLIDSKNAYDEDKECGDPYETKREDIPGYRFVRMHPDSCEPNGKLGEKDCEVIYVYEKIEAPDTGFRADQMPLYALIGVSLLTIAGYGLYRRR